MKLRFLLIGLFASLQILYAQNRTVELRLDLSGQTANPNGIHVAGNFQQAAGFANNWDPAISPMSSLGNNIYSISLSIPDGNYEFKFINGNSWGSDESIPGSCAVNGNRGISINSDTILEYCFNLCVCPPDSFNLSFQIDLSAEAGFSAATDSVDIAGPFNAWVGSFDLNYQLRDPDGDGVYTGTFLMEEGTLDYKARYHNSSGTNWETGANKQLSFDQDSTLAIRCFNADTNGACPSPPDTFDITFQVDLSNEAGFDAANDLVDIAGPFSNWNAAYNAAYQLTDPDGDLVYTATYPFPEPVLEYKARYHAAGVTNWEPQVNNQTVNFNNDSILPIRCFGSDTAGACPSLIDSFYVTLQVDLSKEAGFDRNTDSIDVAGTFNGWNGAYDAAYALTDANNDSIWEITLYLPDSTFDYKARYHNGAGVNWEGGLDKAVTFFSDTTIGVRCFGSDTLGFCPNLPDTFDITFQIDLSNEAGFDAANDLVDIAGPFSNWNAAYDVAYQLTDPDGDLVYTATYPFPEPVFEYKARWHAAGVTNWEPQVNNQIINFSGDSVLAVRCFGSDTAGACPSLIDSFYVTLQIDLSNEVGFDRNTDSIDVAGTFNGWNGAYDAAYALTDANNDSIWEITLYLPDSSFDYKARYHNGAGVNWEGGLDKSVTFFSDTTIGVRCFGSDTLGFCPNLPDTFDITFQIDLSNEAGFDPNTDLVDLAGTFNGWNAAYDAAYQLTDPDGDLVYTATYPFPEPVLEYKARWHAAGVTNWEPQVNNQIINFSGDSVLAVRCFGSDTAGACPSLIDSFYVTLQIDLSNEVGFDRNTDSIDVAGTFNGWNGAYDAAYALTDANNDSIWEITLYLPDSSFDYKARYHNGAGVNWEGGLDKSVTFFSDTTIGVRCFGSDTLGFCPNLPDTFDITFQIDLSNEAGFDAATDLVDIAGPFSNWNAAYNAAYQLSDPDGDLVYTATYPFAEPVLEYKARWHAAGVTNWEPQVNNQTVNFNNDSILPIRCFGSDTAGACPSLIDSFYVTLQVDLSKEAGFDRNTDSIDVAGTFNGWNGAYDAAYALTDANNDSIWEITLYLPDSTFDYKARYHNGAGVNWEGGLDKSVTFFSDTTIGVRCFGSDTLGFCPNLPDTFDITFQIDLSNEAGFDAATDLVDIAGPFSNWNAAYNAAYQLSDPDGDLVYTATYPFAEPVLEYKARWHAAGVTNWEPQVNNQTVNFNNDSILPIRCFGSDTAGACPSLIDSFYVTLQVDLSNEAGFDRNTDSIDVAGTFNGWNGAYDAAYALTDANNDSIWEITLYLPDSSFDYKARYHNGAGVNWEGGLDKSVTFFSDTTVGVRCFGSDTLGFCPNLPDTFDITFQVDLSNEVGFDRNTDLVDLAGTFNGWNVAYDAAYQLTDPDGDLVYSATYPFPEPVLEYKARWHANGVTNWEPQVNNQIINFSGDSVLAVRCFGSDTAGACPSLIDSFYVTLQVDLSHEAGFNRNTDSIDVAGTFNGWNAAYDAAYALTDANNDSIWEVTLYLPDSSFDYKARYHNGAGVNWEGGLDKSVTFFSDTTIGVRCFGSDTLGFCPNLPDTFDITFQIDLSNEAGFDAATDLVDIAGPFSNWNAAYNAAYQLTDPDGDLVYTATYPFPEPVLEYKARWHAAGVTNWEPQVNNQTVNFNNDSILPIRCFGSDTAGACPSLIDSFYVTLQVDLSNEVGFNRNTDSIDVAGTFNGWNGAYDAAYALTDANNDSVWEITLYLPDSTFDYKARYHNGAGVNWEGGLDKSVTFFSDTTIGVRCFGSDTLGFCPNLPDTFDITFQIDLSNEAGFDPNTDLIDVAGTFNGWNAAYDAAYQLTDPDGDLVYTATYPFPEPVLEYKARWHAAGVTNWEPQVNNQTVNFNNDSILPIRCFGSDTAGACPSLIDSFYVTLQIDLSNEVGFDRNTDSIDVAGTFNGWNAAYDAAYALTDANNDSIWEITLYLPDSSFDYKARYHNGAGVNWEGGLDKYVTFFSDTTIGVRCFGSDTLGLCPNLPDTFDITFQVDLSNEVGFDPNTDLVDLAGTFNGWNAAYDVAYQLTDPDGDLVYTATYPFPEPVLEYKARWHAAGVTNWEPQVNNQIINFSGDSVLAVRCFGSDTAGACPSLIDSFYVTLQVDLSNEVGFNRNTDSIDVAGTFNGWNGAYDAAYALTDANNDSIWEVTLYLPDSTFDYKARYHNGAGVNWEGGLDKSVTFFSDTTIGVRCFGNDTLGFCPNLPDTFDITFQVDLSNEAGFDPNTDLIDVAGTFNGWNAAYDAAYQLTDPDGDLVYTATYPFPEPVLEYKARWHAAGVTNWEPQVNNQIINFSGDSVLAVRCFGSDTARACPSLIDSFYVTLQVDLSNEVGFNRNTDSIDVAGTFNGWNGAYDAAYALTDANNDSVWEITLYLPDSTFDYKARYHNGAGVNWEGGLDKSVTFFSDTTIGVRCFGSDTLGFCPNLPDTFDITFQIDLSNEAGFDAANDLVDIAGPFSNWNAAYNAAYQLTDPDGDLVYTATYPFPEPVLEYKARWHANGVTNWEPQVNNQIINFSGDSVLAVRCFGSDTAGACPSLIDSFYVTLQVDLSNEVGFNRNTDSIDVAGTFNGWNGAYDAAYALTDANNDSIWEITLYLPDSTFDYKARYHNGAGVNWEGGLDKSVTFFSDTTIGVRCFGSDTLGLCPNLPDTFDITFQVDLSNEAGFDAATDLVDIAGPFSNWNAAYNAAYQLTDPDGDLVYTATYPFPEPVLEYKARWHANGVTNWEPQVNNQIINFSGDSVLAVRCFGSDTAGACPSLIDSFYVTLQVDLSKEAGFDRNTDSIDVAGTFNGWNGAYDAAYALTDANNDSIWEITLYLPDSTFDYKARYHNGAGVNWEGGLDKSVTFFSDTTIGVRCFGSDTLGFCPNLPDTFDITFQIDLSNEAGFDAATDLVDIAGPFSNWNAAYNAAYQLTDPDGDLVYSATYPFPEPVLEYKARWHAAGVTNWEPQVNNQTVNFNNDSILPIRCFGSETAGACPSLIDSFYVTLQVDLSNEAGFDRNTDSIDVAGTFNGWNGAYDAAYALTDANNDSIWEITLYLPDSTFDYKARYHNGAGVNWEAGLDKSVTFFSDTTIGVRCFGSDTLGFCPNLPDTFDITFQIDLSNEAGFDAATDLVDIAGPFSNWNAAYNGAYQLTDPDGDLVYTATYPFPEPVLEYKARWHAAGVTNWEPQVNNQIINFSGDSVLAVRCFGNTAYGPCTPVIDTFWVTLQVDMNYVNGFNPLQDSVDIAGAFNAWNGNLDLNYLMTDPDGDLVYEYTIYAPEPQLDYKARFHNSNGTNWETGFNKQVLFNSDTIVPVRCFSSDTLGACPSPPPVPGLRFQNSNLVLAEASGTTAVALILSPSNTSADTVAITFSNGTGITSGDYSLNPALQNDTLWLNIPANSDTVYFDLLINDDALVENTEQFSAQLIGSRSGSIQFSSPSTLFVSIIDNDIPPIPHYTIADINGQNLNGLADSIGVYCKISGSLNSIDYKGNVGYDFHIQDGSDALHISSSLDLNSYLQPQIGDSLIFIGTLAQQNGLLSLIPDSLQLLATGNQQPVPINVNHFADSLESKVLRLNSFRFLNPGLWPALNSSAQMEITNGPDTLLIFIDADTDIDGQNAISGSFDLIGVLSQNDPSLPYTEGYLLRPRFYSDFIPINTAAICISEIMPQSSLPSPIGGDWFEIYNYGDISINLNGYSWDDSDGQSGVHTIQQNWILGPGEKLIVLNVQAPFANTWLTDWKQNGNNLPLLIPGRDFNGFSGLSSSGDALYLFDSQGHMVAFSAYSSAQVLRGFSLEFDTLGAYSSRAANGLRGAYQSTGGDIGSPADYRPVSIDELAITNLQVYPNPAQDILNIKAADARPREVKLLDQTGRLIRKWSMYQANQTLSLQGLPAGIYLLQVSDSEEVQQFKVKLNP